MKRYKKLFYCVLAIGIGLLTACSTKKDNFFYRTYHGTTARFNIIFNGGESYKDGMEAMDNTKKDNYTAILPVFPQIEKTEALKQAPKWDRTIEKCSKAIKKHSMLIKGVERCKPIDDAYLLLGKAYYQRQDYADAIGVFNYIINTHRNGNVWPDAFVWKAETELKMDRREDAEESLEMIRQDIANCKKDQYKQHWEAVYSQLLLEQKEYDQASIYLSELLKHKHMPKDFKTRIHFILAQVLQKCDQKPDASKNYAMVLKRNPEYEMEFNATLNMALCDPNTEQAKTHLKKLFKDERNESYKDQIFYILACIDLAEEDTGAAIKNLEASVFWSFDNKHQKAVSSLDLADIYYARGEYIPSLQYYDTLLNNMPKDFPNYADIKRRSEVLKDLVANLMIIEKNDSLLYLASLSETERTNYVEKLIANYQEKEKERIADEDAKAKLIENTSKKRSAANANRNSGANTWIFANPTQNRLAMQSFRKQWGNRTLEDYWFVNDISVVDVFGDQQMADGTSSDDDTGTSTSDATDDASGANAAANKRVNNPNNPNFYLQDMPKNDEEVEKLNNDIATAMYNAGFIYYDDLNDKPKANELFEKLYNRYNHHKLAAPSCFQLYRSYLSLNDMEKSNYYKNLCLTRFGKTDYARIINDPNYYQKIAEQEQEANQYYTSLYDTFASNHYQAAYNMANEGLSKYANSTINAQMEFIRAICVGKLYNLDSLQKHLTQIIARYPTTPIDTAATELLAGIKNLKNGNASQYKRQSSATTQPTAPKINYTYDPKAFHFVIIVADIKDIKINTLKNNIVDFNKDYFRRETFDISSFYIDNTVQMVSISKFNNKEQAMDYYRLLKADSKYMETLNKTSKAKVYVISDANYTTFFKQKESRADYEEFFKNNYLQ